MYIEYFLLSITQTIISLSKYHNSWNTLYNGFPTAWQNMSDDTARNHIFKIWPSKKLHCRGKCIDPVIFSITKKDIAHISSILWYYRKDIKAYFKNTAKEILKGWVIKFLPFPTIFVPQGKELSWRKENKRVRIPFHEIFLSHANKGKEFFQEYHG